MDISLIDKLETECPEWDALREIEEVIDRNEGEDVNTRAIRAGERARDPDAPPTPPEPMAAESDDPIGATGAVTASLKATAK